MVIIMDFGSQYSHLIARRVREANVFCEIVPHSAKGAVLENKNVVGIILSGGPASVTGAATPRAPERIFELGVPLLGNISRFTDQKGIDILLGALEELLGGGVVFQFVGLGSGDPLLEKAMSGLARRHPEQVAVKVAYDTGLAHRIEAGSDFFVMPSRFEPCGLNQLYSLRYGSVPVVRATGGLDDTVRPFDPDTGVGTGFIFHEYSSSAMLVALEAALAIYARPARWQTLQQAGMRQDFSWDASAAAYVHEYRKVIDRRREADGERGE